MHTDQSPQLPHYHYQVTTLGEVDWGAILNLVSSGIKNVGGSIVGSDNAYKSYVGGKYRLPQIEQPAQAGGINSTTIFTIVALGSALLLGGYLYVKKKKKENPMIKTIKNGNRR